MADILMSAPLFVALNDDAAGALRASMVEVTFPKGGVIFSEGDGGDRLYVVLEGKVKLGVSSSDGRENLLSVQGPGEMFGELSLFDPGPRTATATALTDCRLFGLGHEDLRALNPSLITCTVSGFGQGGEMADWPAYDHTIQAISGMACLIVSATAGSCREALCCSALSQTSVTQILSGSAGSLATT